MSKKFLKVNLYTIIVSYFYTAPLTVETTQ